MGKKMYGKGGEDLVIHVPPGTLVFDADHGILLADLDDAGQAASSSPRAARAGAGNWHFKSLDQPDPALRRARHRRARSGTCGSS